MNPILRNSPATQDPHNFAELPQPMPKTPPSPEASGQPGDKAEAPPEEPVVPTPPVVASMKLNQFAEAGLVVRIHSEALGEDILLASDNARIPENPAHVVYRAGELQGLLHLESDQLAKLHTFKRMMSGFSKSS